MFDLTDVPDIRLNDYVNQIDDPTTFALATVYCDTYNYTPTRVIWRRNDIDVEIDGIKYEAYQKVINRQDSYYHNALIIRDITGIIDQPVYTCNVENSGGYNKGTIRLNIEVRVFLSLSGKALLVSQIINLRIYILSWCFSWVISHLWPITQSQFQSGVYRSCDIINSTPQIPPRGECSCSLV